MYIKFFAFKRFLWKMRWVLGPKASSGTNSQQLSCRDKCLNSPLFWGDRNQEWFLPDSPSLFVTGHRPLGFLPQVTPGHSAMHPTLFILSPFSSHINWSLFITTAVPSQVPVAIMLHKVKVLSTTVTHCRGDKTQDLASVKTQV